MDLVLYRTRGGIDLSDMERLFQARLAFSTVNFGGPVHTAVKTRSVIFDFDGTLTMPGAKYPSIGEPNLPVVEMAKKAYDAGLSVIIHSCRVSARIHTSDENVQQLTLMKKWLRDNNVPYDQIWTSDKPLGFLYIDDRSVNPTDTVRMNELVERAINAKDED